LDYIFNNNPTHYFQIKQKNILILFYKNVLNKLYSAGNDYIQLAFI